MATELKTQPNDASVQEFIDSVADPRRRQDCHTVAGMMAEITGCPAVMWGASIVGFGSYRYKYASGREGDWLVCGFSPRKAALTLYLWQSAEEQPSALERLGPHKLGKGCLYLKSLDDVDLAVLREVIEVSVSGALARPER